MRKEFFRKMLLQKEGPSGLRAVGNLSIPVEGTIHVVMERKGQKCEEKVYMVPGAREPHLSRSAIERLGIIRWIRTVTERPENSYQEVLQGLGCLSHPYTLRLKAEARPYAVTTPRKVAIPLREAVRRTLKTMKKEKVISPVDEPTEWCAGMVVPKSNGDIQICVNYTNLNKNVLREKHMLPAVDETLGLLTGAKIFAKLDACSSYYQILLDKKSRKLTTFITPFGRFWFNRLPMGLSSAGEHFQKQMNTILQGIEGECNLMDDILVYAETLEEHNKRMDIVLKRLRGNGVTLNKDKCVFKITSVRFLGHIISAEKEIQPDLDKIKTVEELERPKSVMKLHRFLGMVHYHLKFISHLVKVTQPLRVLLKKNHEFTWTANKLSEKLKKCRRRQR